MAFFHAEPSYRELLQQFGLISCANVLNLPAVLVGCHSDRHVARVLLGTLDAYLKREQRVPWKDRLANALAGFGFVSKARREAEVLQQVRRAGVGCPEVIAAGEQDGQAFLLVRALPNTVDLRTFLRDHLPADPWTRRGFARALGQTLARLHAAGFDHPDLYSKHVLVDPDTYAICILDWQRSRRGRPSRRQCCRDLAALDATVADNLATPLDRLTCLRAYLQGSGFPATRLRRFAQDIRRQALRLLQRRRIRELRQEPLPAGAQILVPFDSGRVHAAPELPGSFGGQIPDWWTLGGAEGPLVRTAVTLPDGRQALLVCRRFTTLSGLWAWFQRRPWLSPERQQADTIFRLQRYGVATPRLLAYGQRQTAPWRRESLLLLEPLPDAVRLDAWLTWRHGRERWYVLGEAARVLRRMHDAGCYFDDSGHGPNAEDLLVQVHDDGQPAVVLGSVERVQVRRQLSPGAVLRDLAIWHARLTRAACSRAEQLRAARDYFGLQRLNADARQFVRRVLRASSTEPPQVAEPSAPLVAPQRRYALSSPEWGARA